VSNFPLKCYKTHTCSGGHRERGGGREAREGGVHRCRQNVIKYTPAPMGIERDWGGSEAKGGRRALLPPYQKPDIVVLQENWLSPDCLYELCCISSDYISFGISAMTNALSKDILTCRTRAFP